MHACCQTGPGKVCIHGAACQLLPPLRMQNHPNWRVVIAGSDNCLDTVYYGNQRNMMITNWCAPDGRPLLEPRMRCHVRACPTLTLTPCATELSSLVSVRGAACSAWGAWPRCCPTTRPTAASLSTAWTTSCARTWAPTTRPTSARRCSATLLGLGYYRLDHLVRTHLGADDGAYKCAACFGSRVRKP